MYGRSRIHRCILRTVFVYACMFLSKIAYVRAGVTSLCYGLSITLMLRTGVTLYICQGCHLVCYRHVSFVIINNICIICARLCMPWYHLLVLIMCQICVLKMADGPQMAETMAMKCTPNLSYQIRLICYSTVRTTHQ